jgi:hypothetical protein
MKKKILYICCIVVPLLFVWCFYSINQSPEWEGHSNSEMWSTSFEDEYSPKGFWNGFFVWKGDESIIVTKVSLKRNDREIHGWDSPVSIQSGETYNYLTTTETLDNKKDDVTLTIYWNDKGKGYQDTIKLSPKSRYFVLPSF